MGVSKAMHSVRASKMRLWLLAAVASCAFGEGDDLLEHIVWWSQKVVIFDSTYDPYAAQPVRQFLAKHNRPVSNWSWPAHAVPEKLVQLAQKTAKMALSTKLKFPVVFS